mgnify:FL=1|jgi:hypothetical protein
MAFNIRENGDTLTWVIDASKVYLQRRHCNKNGLSPLNKRKIPNGAEHVICCRACYSMFVKSYLGMQISELFQAGCSGDHPAILM